MYDQQIFKIGLSNFLFYLVLINIYTLCIHVWMYMCVTECMCRSEDNFVESVLSYCGLWVLNSGCQTYWLNRLTAHLYIFKHTSGVDRLVNTLIPKATLLNIRQEGE